MRAVYQTDRLSMYREHADRLLREGKAYPCYCTPEELEEKRQLALQEKRKPKYDGHCRNLSAPIPGRIPAIRFKAPQEGKTILPDLIKGTIEFDNAEMDDLVILRSDGWPTYNFSVVVDDATMGITHVIRGDDHVNNTPRQILLYQAFGYALAPICPCAHDPWRRIKPGSPSATGPPRSWPTRKWAICPRPWSTTLSAWAGLPGTRRFSPGKS